LNGVVHPNDGAVCWDRWLLKVIGPPVPECIIYV
jgi:hypothetical protein